MSQEHLKDHQSAKDGAMAFHQVVATSGHYEHTVTVVKKAPMMADVLHCKRLLELKVARMMSPSFCNPNETTDGKRVRVYFGPRRKSTCAMISIGKAAAILHCLKWAWTSYVAAQHSMGITQIDVCPYD